VKNLSIDIETKSSSDISKTGSYRYAQDPDFSILLFAYAFDDEDVQIIDLAQGEELPQHLRDALKDPDIVKHAYNAAFEWWCLNQAGYDTPLDQWQCTMIHGLYCGYTAGLDATGKAVGLPQDKQKLTTGKALIRYFCVPRKPTKTDARPWNLPKHSPEKWSLFKEYCVQDVVTEREIWRRVKNFPVPETEWHLWHLDVKMNAFGVRVDRELVEGAIAVNDLSTEKLMEEAKRLTGLENPNSPTQLLEWVKSKGLDMPSMSKEAVSDALTGDLQDDVRRVLEIRQRLGMTSIKKYQAMINCIGPDDRARGVSQFYGANRTGRYSGRLIQYQNLSKNHIDTLDFARKLVRERNLEGIEMFYGNVQDLLSQLVRTASIPSEGRHYVIADFSAIEARVIAWLAGETWVNEEFAGEGKIYEATAAQMFGVPKERIKKGNPEYALRQKGKVATLACIAEGEPVLTDSGLVPIEKVTNDMKLWDGCEWVSHDGVVLKGVKEVITYDGLTATEDHIVWVEGESRPVHFGVAATSGKRLLQSGSGREAVRVGEDNKPRKTLQQKMELLLRADRMHWMRESTVDVSVEPCAGEIERMPIMFKAENISEMAGQTYDCREAEMYEQKRCELQIIRRERDTFRVHECFRSVQVYDKNFRTSGQIDGGRQDRHERKLRAGKSSIFYQEGKLCKQEADCFVRVRSKILAVLIQRCNKKTVSWENKGRNIGRCVGSSCREEEKLERNKRTSRVYDIRNAGPRNRFTVSGKLVHNCGYGGGPNALINMGALKMGIPEEELPNLITMWRNANPKTVKLWRALENAAMRTMKTASPSCTHGLTFRLEGDLIYGQCFLTIELPTHRKLFYARPHLAENRFGNPSIHYFTQGQVSRKWEVTDTYSGKLTENCVQAIARDCLAEVLLRIEKKGWDPVFHVHDEVIVDAPMDVTADDLCALMAEPIPWAPGLVLKGAGFESAFYMKD